MSAEILHFRRHRTNHADRMALLTKATPILPAPLSPWWINFWTEATLAEFRYFGAAVAELTR